MTDKTTDIVESLRWQASNRPAEGLFAEAADEIERLRGVLRLIAKRTVLPASTIARDAIADMEEQHGTE